MHVQNNLYSIFFQARIHTWRNKREKMQQNKLKQAESQYRVQCAHLKRSLIEVKKEEASSNSSTMELDRETKEKKLLTSENINQYAPSYACSREHPSLLPSNNKSNQSQKFTTKVGKINY
jgi:hypothetical protein